LTFLLFFTECQTYSPSGIDCSETTTTRIPPTTTVPIVTGKQTTSKIYQITTIESSTNPCHFTIQSSKNFKEITKIYIRMLLIINDGSNCRIHLDGRKIIEGDRCAGSLLEFRSCKVML